MLENQKLRNNFHWSHPPRMKDTIKGARQHNLKNISVTIPHDQLAVITVVSGSGKSTLAFVTLYVKGQRRYT
ncbi:MAG: hypothetical protein Q8S57_03235 [Methanoregula sp.]|nr:hypothetical protein [Methanoregula sp.]